MDLNTISEPVLVQGAAIIVAIISLIGTIVTSWFSLKEKQKQKATEAENQAKEEAAQQKKEAERAKKALEEERRNQEMKELKRKLQKVQDDLDAVNKRSAQRALRVDRRYNKTNMRIADNEEGITKITQILAKNARSYSGLMRFNDQMTSKVQQIIRMERHNLALTRGVADILEELAQVVLSCTENSPNGDFSKELADLAVIIRKATETKTNFLNSMMDATFETVMSDAEKKSWRDSGHESLGDINSDLEKLVAFRPGNHITEEPMMDEEEDDEIKSLQEHLRHRHKEEDSDDKDDDDDDEEEPTEISVIGDSSD